MSVLKGARRLERPGVEAVRVWGTLLGGGALLLLLSLLHVLQGALGLSAPEVLRAVLAFDGSSEHAVVRYVRLPRTAVGVLAGAALAVSGLMLQTVTRNALASPATLGVNAGAYLAVVAATLFAPGLLAFSPLLTALLGGLGAAALVYALAASAHVTPLRLVLAGTALSLALAAVTGTLQLLYEGETAGLFLWGAGRLEQNDWSGTLFLLPRVGAALLLALLLARTLDLLLLGDEVARSLGLKVARSRLLAALVAVFLASAAVSVVGPLAFVGLVVPHLLRLLGLKAHRHLLLGSALWGGALLVGADALARGLSGGMQTLPAGAVTALLGAPWLVWLARRAGRAGEKGALPSPARPPLPYALVLGGAASALLLAFTLGLALGPQVFGPAQLLAGLSGADEVVGRVLGQFRLPRLVVAALAGGALATSGLLLQGVVRNPLAGPEVIGITSGAGVGALGAMVLFPGLPPAYLPVAAFLGAGLAFGVVYAASWRGGLEPTRLALVGLSVSAFAAALISVFVVRAQLRVAQALVWLAGSTYAAGWSEALRVLPWLLLLLPFAWLAARWLDLLALGQETPQALGLPVARARTLVLGAAVALAAAAVSAVGTVGFVGLMAPHAARLSVGHRHRRLLPVAFLLGALLVVAADTLGRTLLAPKEIPSGLVTALLGAPYFLWLLWRSKRLGG